MARYTFIVLSVLFFLTRLIHLDSIPILNDEGIYLHWGSQLFDRDASIKFPFVAIDGKQFAVPVLLGLVQMLPLDPLISARSAVVVFSFITFISMLAVQKKLFPKTSSWSLALLLIFCPYLLYYDRTALPDSIVAAFYSLAFLITVHNLELQSFKKNIALGAAIAAGWWFKSSILLAFPAIFSIYLYISVKRKYPIRRLIISLSVITISFLIFVSPLLATPSFWRSPAHGFQRVISSDIGIRSLFIIWRENIQRVIQLFTGYTTPFAVIALVLAILFPKKNIVYPLLWFCVPLVIAILILNSIMAPRWIVFLVPGFLLLVHEGIYALPKYKKVLLGFTISTMIIFSLIQIFSPLTYYKILRFLPTAGGDLGLTGWTSGYGVKEAADYVRTLAQKKRSIVFLADHSGNPEDGIYVYLKKDSNIMVMGDVNYQYMIKYKDRYKNLINTTDFYFISRGNQFGDLKDVLILVAQFKKPLDDDFVGLYKVKIE